MTEDRGQTISRRKLLRAGAGGIAGAIAVAWTKPAIATVPVVRASHTVLRGQPSLEVSKTVSDVQVLADDGTSATLQISGTITIENVSDEPVPVTIISVDDTVEYRSGGDWNQAPTTEVTIPCEGETIAENGSCSGPYTVTATVPSNYKALRNVVEVQAENRDKIFLYRAEVEFSS